MPEQSQRVETAFGKAVRRMERTGRLVAGMDIGNSTTEVILMNRLDTGENRYVAGAMTPTTGIKGTPENVNGCVAALDEALQQAGLAYADVAQIRLNQAAPVISDLSMDTVSETTVVGSAMIGHNPDTPGGEGLAVGSTLPIGSLHRGAGDVVVLVDADCPYYQAADRINNAPEGCRVVAAICRKDDGVLIANRLKAVIPIVDEVAHLEKVETGIPAAVEVAKNGESIRTLSNPYGLAGLFGLSPQETREAIPVARSLTGCRSGVVLRAKGASVKVGKVRAGYVDIQGKNAHARLDVNEGADALMQTVARVGEILDIYGEQGTNAGALLTRVKDGMASLTGQSPEDLHIVDMLAADTFASVEVAGALAGESAMENVVMLAAMVQTSRLPMQAIADELSRRTGIYVRVAGREAEMALKGAMTTPGADMPLAILDLGGGSTDAALIDAQGKVTAIHHAGAGEMVTRIIDLELDLRDRDTAELIKKYPLAKVESLLFLRFEDGSVKFVSEPLPPELFARVVIVTEDTLVPIRSTKRLSIDRIALVRREAKRKVFVANAQRALREVAPDGDMRRIGSVALVGGSAQDFEIADLLAEYLMAYRITTGRANPLGFLAPHSAVALGLALADDV